MSVGTPNWSKLSTDEKLRLTALYTSGDRIALEQEAENLQIKLPTLERQIRGYKHNYTELMQYLAQKTFFPESAHERNQDYTVLNLDKAIILGDVEVPDQDDWMLKAALLVAMRRNITTLIWNGDIIATDQSSLNTWDEVWKERTTVSYEDALKTTEEVMIQYGQWFKDQYFVSGNHDQRVNRASKGEIHLGMLLKTTPTLFSRFSYLYIKTSNRGWVYVCHPKRYSDHAASGLGRKLWASHTAPDGSKCHIVLAHTHLDQMAWSPDSQQEIHAVGCMRRQAGYADLVADTYPSWQRGFLVLDNGYFYHYSEQGTNWQQELGDLYYTLPQRI